MTPVDVGNLIVPREPFVDVGIVRGQKVDDASIVVKLAADEEPRLLQEGVSKVFVEFRVLVGIGHDAGESAQLKPLAREVVDQRLRSRVAEHPPNLPLELDRVAQFAGDGDVEQFVVGDAAPEKERQRDARSTSLRDTRFPARDSRSRSMRNRKLGDDRMRRTPR